MHNVSLLTAQIYVSLRDFSKLQKLQTVFLEWKLAVEADKLLPDVNHLILSHITAKDQFRKSALYEELKRKLRALLVTLRQSILFSRGLQLLIAPNRGEYATVENDLPNKKIRYSSIWMFDVCCPR